MRLVLNRTVSIILAANDFRASLHLHHSPAEQRDQDHKSPAGDHAETPQNVASRDGQTILREEAIEGMEYALAFHGRSLVAILL